MLKSSDGCNSLCLDRPTPLKIDEVENEQVIEPVLAVTSSEHEHHVFDDASSVELTHGGFASDDARDVE